MTQFRVMSGTKTQSYNKGSQDQIGTSPLGLITFIDFQATEKFYFSFGTSFEMSTETYSTSGFTIYGSAMYYLYGAPGMVESDTENMKMNLFYPYSVYASAGIFQKQIKIRSIDSEDSTITKDLGGLQAGVGFNYNLNAKIYLTSHLQMLMSGMGSSSEYSSTEFYIGLGLRL
ncbi:MAG: hypothetical protein ACRBBP_00020 [Bdellovibrionales bacterium]